MNTFGGADGAIGRHNTGPLRGCVRHLFYVYETYKSCAGRVSSRGGDPIVGREDVLARRRASPRGVRASHQGPAGAVLGRLRPVGGRSWRDATRRDGPRSAPAMILVDTSVWIDAFRARGPLDLERIVSF